jgi:transposase
MSGSAPLPRWLTAGVRPRDLEDHYVLRLGIDIACRAAHQASLADERGEFIWSGRRFLTTSRDLEDLWQSLPTGTEAADVMVVMEPTRNAWVPLAAWFRRLGARVVLVPPEQSADLRAYYSKHTKTDRLDSKILARLPMLHPNGFHADHGLGPADALRRAVKIRSGLVKQRSTAFARIDAQLEILGPGWLAAFSADLANTTPLRFLAAGYADPNTVRRLGRARLGRFFYRHSRGRWGELEAARLLAAADETLLLWNDELDYSDLAEDIAVHARLALHINNELKELDDRIRVMLQGLDPNGIVTSAPGIAQITGAAILGRLGDPARFRSLAGVRSFSGLVPSLEASGLSAKHGAPTKQGDAVLREALFIAADHARRVDPQLASKYHRLMVRAGKHHNSALCHVATNLLTRVVACWRRGERYLIRDIDGRPLSVDEGRRIVTARFSIPQELRAGRRLLAANHRRLERAKRRSQESPSAPSPRPPSSKVHPS